ncbi:MAG: hypothetical protein AAF317_05645, partial [Pseudomonadota bacterium]
MANALISEIKYLGGAGVDFIEVRVDAGSDVSGVQIVIYNNNGTIRTTNALEGQPSSNGAFDIYVISTTTSTTFNGVALNNAVAVVEDGVVGQFISFDDTASEIEAQEGPANGLTSDDVGMAPGGSSLERQP